MNSQITFDEWALDVTCPNTIAFVPLCGNEVFWNTTLITDRCPGTLTAVVSQNGIQDAKSWAADHPSWQIDFSKAEDLTNV